MFVIYSCGLVKLPQTTLTNLQEELPGILFMTSELTKLWNIWKEKLQTIGVNVLTSPRSNVQRYKCSMFSPMLKSFDISTHVLSSKEKIYTSERL